MAEASDLIDIGKSRVGQKYILGAKVPLDNPNWAGPWDCAEFASWVVYQACGYIFGANTQSNLAIAEPYSGFWAQEATKKGTIIPWQDALKIEGAVLIRRPAPGKIGHVAFAIGDGDKTLEARGAQFGVGIFGGAKVRAWSFGYLLPGVDYDTDTPVTIEAVMPGRDFPDGYMWWKKPPFKSAEVVAVQKALKKAGIDPGPVDAVFARQGHMAVASFQLQKGVEVDGVVGPTTAKKLGLDFPIVPTATDIADFNALTGTTGPSTIAVPNPASATIDTVATIAKQGAFYKATTAGGFQFIIGSETIFTDDMRRVGLFQGPNAINDSKQFGVYKAADFASFGKWAHFIEPTLNAEGGARFATVNAYDRAAFTFGAPQLAAHTPGENFVEYFRQLLLLPEASTYFPDLKVQANAAGKQTIHLISGGAPKDLEKVLLVTRPNGKKENQIPELMKYLNSSATAVDDAELKAAARLMLWLKQDKKAAELQISVFIDAIKKKLAETKTKVPAFDGKDWEVALWIMDIRHQGRGSFVEIANALLQSNKAAALQQIGKSKYASRINTVAAAVAQKKASGVLSGFEV